MQFELDHISLGYDDKIIVSDLSLQFPNGKITVILGSNGCGKSTLLKGCTKLLKPFHGTIKLDGMDISKIKQKDFSKKVAMMMQSSIAPEGLSVYDLLARGRYAYRTLFQPLSKEDHQAIQQAMEWMNITHLKDQPVDSLSGGQRQRVWIALALTQQTEFLFLDEPTTFLDIAYQVEILDLLSKINREKNITIVMVLHDINLSIRYSDYIIAMKDGQLIAQGDPNQIITKELIHQIYDIDSHIILDPNDQKPMIIPQIKQKI